MGSKRLEIRMSADMLDKIDKAARANLTTRSGYIRHAVVMRLNDEHLAPNPKKDDILELLKRS